MDINVCNIPRVGEMLCKYYMLTICQQQSLETKQFTYRSLLELGATLRETNLPVLYSQMHQGNPVSSAYLQCDTSSLHVQHCAPLQEPTCSSLHPCTSAGAALASRELWEAAATKQGLESRFNFKALRSLFLVGLLSCLKQHTGLSTLLKQAVVIGKKLKIQL